MQTGIYSGAPISTVSGRNLTIEGGWNTGFTERLTGGQAWDFMTATVISNTKIIITGGNNTINLDGVTFYGYNGSETMLKASGAGVTLSRLVIKDNSSSILGSSAVGGIVNIDGVTIEKSYFNNNLAVNSAPLWMYYNVASPNTIKECLFDGNSGTYSGAVYARGNTTVITACRFSNNNAALAQSDGGKGGAIRWNGGSNIGSATIANNIFIGNTSATGQGNAVMIGNESGINNCNFTGNLGEDITSGGFHFSDDCQYVIENATTESLRSFDLASMYGLKKLRINMSNMGTDISIDGEKFASLSSIRVRYQFVKTTARTTQLTVGESFTGTLEVYVGSGTSNVTTGDMLRVEARGANVELAGKYLYDVEVYGNDLKLLANPLATIEPHNQHMTSIANTLSANCNVFVETNSTPDRVNRIVNFNSTGKIDVKVSSLEKRIISNADPDKINLIQR